MSITVSYAHLNFKKMKTNNINNPVKMCKAICFENHENLLRRAINILAKRQIRKKIKMKENKKSIAYISSSDIYFISKRRAKKLHLLN